MAYDRTFYEEQSRGSRNSARRIVPWLLARFPVKSVVDLGCGLGTWLAEFAACGVDDIAGYDGAYVPREYLQIPEKFFHSMDLGQLPEPDRRFDLAVSLECAEHLPLAHAEYFVGRLTSFADLVLFSAAFPYQGGTGHLNENFPEFWAILFRQRGYIPLDLIREEFWNDGKVCPWYRQNMLLFVKRELYAEKYAALPNAEGLPLARVHPELYLWSCVRRPPANELDPAVFEEDKRDYYRLLDAWRENREMPRNIRGRGPEFDIEYSEMSRWRKWRLKLAFYLHGRGTR